MHEVMYIMLYVHFCSAVFMQHLHATGIVRDYTQCIPRENAIKLKRERRFSVAWSKLECQFSLIPVNSRFLVRSRRVSRNHPSLVDQKAAKLTTATVRRSVCGKFSADKASKISIRDQKHRTEHLLKPCHGSLLLLMLVK